ncbi:MAG: AgmX/PglI C-terminal domain-containing protein [bacterium]
MSRLHDPFPREFQARPFGDLDRTLLFLLMLFATVSMPTIWRLKDLPIRVVTQHQREEYLRIIYRAQPPAGEAAPRAGEGLVEEEGVVPGVEKAPGRETVRQREERRRREALARTERRQTRLAKARSTGIFTAAGAQMPSFSSFNAGALSLTGGSLEGLEVGSVSELVSSPDAEAIAGLRERGLLNAPPPTPDLIGNELEDVDLALSEAQVVLDALPKVRGRASEQEARSEAVLQRVIGVELSGLRACYLAQKRKDTGLLGSLDVRMVVLPPGDVARVRFLNSTWSNPALGRRVERCLLERIGRWRFDPATGGEVTLEFPLVFK